MFTVVLVCLCRVMVEWETEPGAKVFSTYRVVVKGLKSQKQEGGGVIWLVD